MHQVDDHHDQVFCIPTITKRTTLDTNEKSTPPTALGNGGSVTFDDRGWVHWTASLSTADLQFCSSEYAAHRHSGKLVPQAPLIVLVVPPRSKNLFVLELSTSPFVGLRPMNLIL